MIEQPIKKFLEKQGYRFTGDNSCCKICEWTKKSLLDKNICYKEQFYGIKSHQCCQMTPCLVCSNSCIFCWRSVEYSNKIKMREIDEPKNIINNCIIEQRKLLNGFKGNVNVNKKKFKEAQNINSFAISLLGEPTMYPKLNEFLEELHKRKIISFLVTNGQFPEAIAKLNKLPTQLYLSLDAPTKQIYKKLDRPKLKDYWSRLNKTLDLIKDLDMRTVIRITAIKNLNMLNEKEYAKLIEKANPKFVEIKSFMLIGDSRERLSFENMPSHEDIKNFGKKISSLTGYGIVDEKKDSRVVLLMREDKGRFINK